MRKLVLSTNTVFTANLLLGGVKLLPSPHTAAFQTARDYDDAVLRMFAGLPRGTTVVVLGNLFSNRANQDRISAVLQAFDDAGLILTCLEGNQDHNILWNLLRQKKIRVAGDLAVIQVGSQQFVCSCYPMLAWPQRDRGVGQLYGMSCDPAATRGQVSVSADGLFTKTGKPWWTVEPSKENFANDDRY